MSSKEQSTNNKQPHFTPRQVEIMELLHTGADHPTSVIRLAYGVYGFADPPEIKNIYVQICYLRRMGIDIRHSSAGYYLGGSV